MGLILKANTGPLEGQTFPIQGEMILGRQNATINLNDPKVSSVHARITNAGGTYRVLDNNSKNGLRDANGDRIESTELKPGTIFQIGATTFEVVETPEASAQPQQFDPAFVTPKKKEKKQARLWYELLAEFLETNVEKFKNEEKILQPLNPGLILEFVRGVQVNSKWILGFGPRKVGAASLDLPIWEPNAPDVCFEIHADDQGGLVFTTAHKDRVQLNGQQVDSEVLRMGDTIQINETLIEVDFVE